jgi:hypothetical protein
LPFSKWNLLRKKKSLGSHSLGEQGDFYFIFEELANSWNLQIIDQF